eukprot:TRINITY_DN3420_c0_g2_i1.p1 TRINITY_DN3420_c0_g2~~TRINITY_DN3420_c0_g2_i1.p1  ORF type:complete len:834 (+),score=142.39 TRINITY_DN3420_c0_g2_i1:140-2641(+)
MPHTAFEKHGDPGDPLRKSEELIHTSMVDIEPDWFLESRTELNAVRDELKSEIDLLRVELGAMKKAMDGGMQVAPSPVKLPMQSDQTQSGGNTGTPNLLEHQATDAEGDEGLPSGGGKVLKQREAGCAEASTLPKGVSRRSRRRDPVMRDANRVEVQLTRDRGSVEVLNEALDDSLIDQYPLQPSVYDAMILAWTPVQSRTSSFFLVAMLLVNAFVQVYYCYIVYFAFVVPQGDFTQEDILGYRNWRENVAHDVSNMDRLSQVSLASRVCDEAAHASLEFSTAQANAVQDITEYITDFRGAGMTTVSVFCWLIFVSDELRSVLACIQAIHVLPVGVTSMTVSYIAYRIDFCSNGRKLMMYFVLFIRICVAALLASIGSYFLIYTRTVGDLILNAVALEMVQHMDKLIFRTLAPLRVKKCMSMLQPLLLDKNFAEGTKGSKPLLGIGRGALLTLAFAMLSLGAFMPIIVDEHMGREAALQEICPFNTEKPFADRSQEADKFVYGLDGTGMLLWTATPSFDESAVSQVHRIATVKDVIQLGVFNVSCEGVNVTDRRCAATARQLPLIDNSLSSLLQNVRTPVDLKLTQFHGDPLNFVSETSRFQGCHDVARADGMFTELTNKSGLRPWILGSLSNALGSYVSDCSEVEKYCLSDSLIGLRTRMWCPATCGCFRPDAPNQVSLDMGCPAQCAYHPEYQAATHEAECTDVSPTDAKWPSFQRFAMSLVQQGKDHGPLYAATLEKIAGGMMMLQCRFVAMMGMCQTDAEDGQRRVVKNTRYWCPVTCGCSRLEGALDCPTACNGTQVALPPGARPFAKRLAYTPGLPGTSGAIPSTLL